MKNKFKINFEFKKSSLPHASFKLSDEKKKDIVASTIVISALLIFATLVISFSANLLQNRTEKSAERIVLDAIERIMPAERYEKSDMVFDEAMKILSLYEAKNGDELVGYCVETEAKGYENQIRLVVGIDPNGAVTRVEILAIDETSGYNSRVNSEEFLSRFAGKNEELTVVKTKADTSSKIAAVSGATVSSTGIKDGVNHAIGAVSKIRADAETEKKTEEVKLSETTTEETAEVTAETENSEVKEEA